jgi:predicted  nucleic acid-binding Zn-ribbon protein
MTHTCRRCGHKWTPRTEETPKCCPACKSYRWDRDREPRNAKRKEEGK